MLKLRIDGYTYEEIALKAGVTRQRIQQLLAPPKEIRDYVIKKYDGRCVDCGLIVGKSGQVHHENFDTEAYNDINNLVLLCKSCHRGRHHFGLSLGGGTRIMDSKEIHKLRKKLGLTQKELAARVRVDAITVSRWELEKQRPSQQALRQLTRLAKKG